MRILFARCGRAAVLALIALLVPVLCDRAAAAQDAAAQDAGEPFTLPGVVVDVRTEAPVSGAVVHIQELRRTVYADTLGRFAFTNLRPGAYTFATTRLGYADNIESAEIGPGETLVVRLLPRPVVLEAVSVLADRFETRRLRTGLASRASDRNQLLASAAPTIAEFLSDRHQLRPVPCPGATSSFEECMLIRGRPRVPRVYVDDMPTPGGVFLLQTYHPLDVYRVEAYPSLAQIRIYTNHYVERLAENGRFPGPICLVC